MKTTNLTIVLGILFILFSCSNKQGDINTKIQNKWWIEKDFSELPNKNLIFFKKNGEFLNFYTNEKNNYTISDGKLKIDEKTFNIPIITDTSFVIVVNNKDSVRYVVAEKIDFIAGKWKGLLNDKLYKLEIKYSNKDGWYYKENNNEYQTLNLGNNSIGVLDVNYTTLFKDEFNYTMSENNNELTLKNNNNIIKFYRDSYIEKLKEDKNLNNEISLIIKKDSLNTIIENINYSVSNILLLNIKSKNDLVSIFGEKSILSKIDTNYYGEGENMEIEYFSILYPNTSDEILFKWKDGKQSNLTNIIINNEYSSWNYNNIKIGLHLNELEKINGKPFTFYGFDMDAIPVGTIENFNGGKFDAKKIYVEFKYTELLSGISYDAILSNSEIAQKANPIVKSFSIIVK